MAHAFAELRYGIVARQHENGFKCGYISAQTLYYPLGAGWQHGVFISGHFRLGSAPEQREV
jgi:hypothetical protein